MKVIVSFTSYPKRIGMVHKVVESLLEQTIRADAILLYLSLDEFPHEESDLPDMLREMIGKHGFRIIWVKGNLKSHKKYYYALQEYCDDVVSFPFLCKKNLPHNSVITWTTFHILR